MLKSGGCLGEFGGEVVNKENRVGAMILSVLKYKGDIRESAKVWLMIKGSWEEFEGE